MKKKKELMKNTVIIFLGRAMTYVISFLLLPLYTAKLETGDYGIVDLITTYVTLLVPIITLELEMSVFRYLVDARGKENETKKILSNNFVMLFLGIFVFTFLYCMILPFFHFKYQFLILLDIIICTFSGNFLQISRGLGKTIDYAISCIITGVSTILLNILFLVVLNMNAPGMILAITLANGFGAVYLFFKLKLYTYIQFSLKDPSLIREMNRYSIPLIPNGVSWWIVNVSDRTIISVVLGSAANGLYAVSNKFPTIISSLLGVFNLSWGESAALHINSPDRDEFFSDVVNSAIRIFTCLGIGMLACMPFVFPLLVHSKFSDAYSYIPFLVLGAVFNVVICLYSGIYIAKKLTKQVAITSIIGAVINILVNVLFIKKIGLYAAALSTTLSYFIMMVYRYVDIKKHILLKYEWNILLITVIAFTITIYSYYQRNFYLNIFVLIAVICYSIFMNRKFLNTYSKKVLKKIKK